QIVDPRTERALEHGARIRAVLGQSQGKPYSPAVGVALLLSVQEGLLDKLPLASVARFKASLAEDLVRAEPALVEHIDQTGELSDAERTTLVAWLGGRARDLESRPAGAG
ncbi:MAG TPA: hypothetical protein VG963_31860, partial [Polyangiaceae bacterium]|nr:hypothetical protein [Polyangiaceae bacterium]